MKKIVACLCIGLMGIGLIDCSKKDESGDTDVLMLLLLVAAYNASRAGRSCNVTSAGACIDYNNAGLTTSMLTTDCTGAGTSLDLTLNCAARNPSLTRVGTCNCNSGWAGSFSGATNITSIRYYSTNYTTATAQTSCNSLSVPTFVAN